MVINAVSSALSEPRWLRVGGVYRYPRGVDVTTAIIDGVPNLHYRTVGRNGTQVHLRSGINPVASIQAIDGPRRPVIALRSSPWKAGGFSTPWHDVFDLDHGHVRYFGDHKASTTLDLGSTRGNAALLAAWPAHQGMDRDARLTAAPITLFRSVTVNGVVKGHVQFCGVAVIERVEYIVQRDPSSGQGFANHVYDLCVLSTATENEQLDWRWIDDRRDPTLTSEQSLRYAPRSWSSWIKDGATIFPRIRRSVAATRIRSVADQQPAPGTPEADILKRIYTHFDGRKHAFELLAALIAAEVLRGRGSTYHEGWITRGGGDGGTDFVGRLDIGIGHATTSLVVLGQAKCILPTTAISADQIARVIARLQRGWIGVYVTTGTYSAKAQEEIIDDRYPIVLIDGATLATHTRRLASLTAGDNLNALLDKITTEYPTTLASRRPEEILNT